MEKENHMIDVLDICNETEFDNTYPKISFFIGVCNILYQYVKDNPQSPAKARTMSYVNAINACCKKYAEHLSCLLNDEEDDALTIYIKHDILMSYILKKTCFANTITYGDIYVLHQRLKIQLQQLYFDLSELYSTGQKRRNMYLKMKDHCCTWQEFPQFD